MRCRECLKILADERSRALTPEESGRLQEHLRNCPECRERRAWMRGISAALSRVEERRAPADFNQRVWRRLGTEAPVERPVFRWQPWGLALGAVTAALAAVLVLSRTLQQMPLPDSTPQTASKPVEISGPSRPAETHRSEKPKNPSLSGPVRMAEQLSVPQPVRPSTDGTFATPPDAQVLLQGPIRHAMQEAGPQKAGSATTATQPGIQAAEIAGTEARLTAAAAQVSRVRLANNTLRVSQGERTRIEVQLTGPGEITLRMYSREGRLVRTVFAGQAPAGLSTYYWDGLNDQGVRSASGVYILLVQGPGYAEKFKIALVK